MRNARSAHDCSGPTGLVIDELVEVLQHGPGEGAGMVQLWAVGGSGDRHEIILGQGCDEFVALAPDARQVEFSRRHENRSLESTGASI